MTRSSNNLAARTGLFVILASASLAVGGARSFTNTALTTGDNPLPFESRAVDVETLHELWVDIDSELDQLHQRIDDLEDHGGAVSGGGGGAGGIAGTFQRVFSSPGSCFIQRFSTTTVVRGFDSVYATNTGSLVQFFAPVHLPHGALVTGMEATVLDADAAQNITVSLGFVTSTSAFGGMATATSTGSLTSVQNISTTTITQGATIDNKSRSYHLVGSWTVPATTFAIKLCRVCVTYTIEEPLP